MKVAVNVGDHNFLLLNLYVLHLARCDLVDVRYFDPRLHSFITHLTFHVPTGREALSVQTLLHALPEYRAISLPIPSATA